MPAAVAVLIGATITPEYLEQIFAPFFSSKFMGLPLVLGILRVHKVCVTVASEPNQGTTVRAFFPLP